MYEDVSEVLLTEEQIQQRVRELAEQISADYRGKDLLLVCILKGGVLFLTDLMRQLDIPHAVDFMAISSYGAGTESSGVVRILMDLNTSIEGKNVLIVEDIVDTGHTLDYILRNLSTRRPASLKVCALLNKPSRRQVDVPIHYIGFDIPNKFVIGYGLDFGEKYRNLPFVGVLKPEFYR
ncbi:MAG: hypoxanthine phosphoribosyltransferase [Chloroflexi bacterium]|nr:hypoxanthine phosphoribosyltransferase [Chloroflexota bacterium]